MRDLALFVLRGMSGEELETLVDMTFDGVLNFDFGSLPPPKDEESEGQVNRVFDIAQDMQKYGLIGSMARVDEILGILEEASRILKEDGYGTLVFERLVFQ